MTARRKTGARPSPRHVLAGATPHRIVGATPAAWIQLPQKLSMWLNDVDGDCVTAEEAFARACSGILIADATVQAWASAHGVLNGADLAEVLDWMAQKGFAQDGNLYGAGGKSSIDYTSAAVLQNAIYHGPVKIGVAAAQLQNVVGNGNGWFAVGFSTDQNLDHCVSLCGYGTLSWLAQQLGVSVPAGIDGTKQGYALFTWDTVGIIDAASMVAITGEAWLRTPTTVVVGANPVPADPVYTPVPLPPAPPIPVPPVPVPAGPTEEQVQGAVDALWAHHRLVSKAQIDQAIQQVFAAHAPAAAGFALPSIDWRSIEEQVRAWIAEFGPLAKPAILQAIDASSMSAAEKMLATSLVNYLLPGSAAA
jgi:hypothetical protein